MKNEGLNNVVSIILVIVLAFLGVKFIMTLGSIIFKIIGLLILGLLIAFIFAYISKNNQN